MEQDFFKKLSPAERIEAERGMRAWNAMTKPQRAAALEAAKTACPAEAMRSFGFHSPKTPNTISLPEMFPNTQKEKSMGLKDDHFIDINLQILSMSEGYRTNIAVIRKLRETTLECLKSELRCLEGRGLVTIDETGPVLVAELTEQGRGLVEGWNKPKSKPKGAGGTGPNSPTVPQWRLLECRARQVGYSGLADPLFIAWMKPRGKVDHPRFLDKDGARRVIAALGNWINQKSVKTQKGEEK